MGKQDTAAVVNKCTFNPRDGKRLKQTTGNRLPVATWDEKQSYGPRRRSYSEKRLTGLFLFP